MKSLTIAVCFLTLLAACSKPVTETEGEDLLKVQREAMEKAKDLEDEMQKSLEERMQDVDGN
jgi:hypothetical protein